MTMLPYVLVGASIGVAVMLMWWLGRALVWLGLALFYMRREDVRRGMGQTYRALREIGRTPVGAAIYALIYARESYFSRSPSRLGT